jgi:hypothetical protein
MRRLLIFLALLTALISAGYGLIWAIQSNSANVSKSNGYAVEGLSPAQAVTTKYTNYALTVPMQSGVTVTKYTNYIITVPKQYPTLTLMGE